MHVHNGWCVSQCQQEHLNLLWRSNYRRRLLTLESPPTPSPAWWPPEPLSSSPHVVTHALTYNAHAVCSSSARTGRRSPALSRQRSKRETKSLGWWESAEWPADFSMCVHFLTINPTAHLAQGVPVMLTMPLEQTQHPDYYHPRGNYKEKPIISCHARSNSTNRLGIVAPSQRIKQLFLIKKKKSCGN